MQRAIEPEIIFPDSEPEARVNKVSPNPIVFALKIAFTGLIGLFVVLVVMICFPISFLCTLSTVLTSSVRLLVTHLWAFARGRRPE